MYEFDIQNMTCGHCKGTVEITLDPAVIGQAIEDAGCPVSYARR